MHNAGFRAGKVTHRVETSGTPAWTRISSLNPRQEPCFSPSGAASHNWWTLIYLSSEKRILSTLLRALLNKRDKNFFFFLKAFYVFEMRTTTRHTCRSEQPQTWRRNQTTLVTSQGLPSRTICLNTHFLKNGPNKRRKGRTLKIFFLCVCG